VTLTFKTFDLLTLEWCLVAFRREWRPGFPPLHIPRPKPHLPLQIYIFKFSQHMPYTTHLRILNPI